MGLLGSGKRIVGLDIGSTSVKAVELSMTGGRLLISGMGSAEIPSADAIGDAIQVALREGGIKSTRCVSSVSGRSVIFRQVSMVQMADSELRQAAEYEADKYIPFEVGEVQLDAQRIEDGTVTESGQMKVLLVAVKKALIEEHINLLQSVGLSPVVVDVDVFALGNAFELRNLSLGIADDEVRALVDIGASKTNINIMRGNKSFFHREIYVAGNDLTDAIAKRFGEDPKDVDKMKRDPGGALESMQDAMLPVLEDIGNEIKLSFDYYENQYEQQVKEVFLSGGTVFFPGVDNMLGQIFNLPTQLWDPTEGLEITNYSSSRMGGSSSDMAIALGLASRLLSGTARVSVSAAPARAAGGQTAGGAPTTVGLPMVQQGGITNWLTGMVLGLVAAAVVGAAAFYVNLAGYQTAWVLLLEAVPIGLAAGLGLWQGIKGMRPLPSRAGIVFSSIATALLVCGGLLGARVELGGGALANKEKPPKINLPRGMTAPELPKSQTDLVKTRLATNPTKKASVDITDISVMINIFAHGLVAVFCCSMMATWRLRKLEETER